MKLKIERTPTGQTRIEATPDSRVPFTMLLSREQVEFLVLLVQQTQRSDTFRFEMEL